MICRQSSAAICMLTIFFLSFLYGNEFLVITTEHSPRLGMFAAANQVLGHLYLFENRKLPHVSGLIIDFEKYGALLHK